MIGMAEIFSMPCSEHEPYNAVLRNAGLTYIAMIIYNSSSSIPMAAGLVKSGRHSYTTIPKPPEV